MVFLFIIILLMLLIINVQIIKDFFHPTVIFKIVWIISATILLSYQNRWGVSLSFQTVCIFLVGFLSFDLGFLFFYLVKNMEGKHKQLLQKENLRRPLMPLKRNRIIFLFLVVIFLLIYLIVDITRTVGGITAILSETFFVDYRSIKYNGTDTTNIQQFLFRIIEAIGIASFIFFLREKDKSKIRTIVYITIILLTFGIQTLTTGRMRFLAIIVQVGIIYLIHARKNGKFLSFSTQGKYIKKVTVFFIIFIFIFFLYGKFAVDKIDSEDPFSSIAIYTSSSLPAFDLTWQITENSSEYFGQAVFSPIYNILNKLFGIDFSPSQEQAVKPFIRGDNGFSTNVYTLYDQQVADFGPWFIPFVMISIGIFISFLKFKSETESSIGFWTALYSMFIFSLVISFFQDTFFTNSTFTFITILMYILIFKTTIINSKKGIGNLTVKRLF